MIETSDVEIEFQIDDSPQPDALLATTHSEERVRSALTKLSDDQMRVVERYTPVSPYHLIYEATIEDPKVFTRPWKIRFPLYRRLQMAIDLRGNGGGSTMIVRPTAALIYNFR